MRGEEERVLEDSQAEGKEGVKPERNGHAGDGPGAVGVVDLVSLDDVLLCSSDDGGYREEERTQEESLTLVRDRALESTRELGETQNHGAADAGEEDEVDDVEDGSDGNQARESMRLNGDQCSDTTCGHSKCVPSPCEMAKTLAKWHVWLVWILPVWQLRVVVPTASVAVIVALLLLEVD